MEGQNNPLPQDTLHGARLLVVEDDFIVSLALQSELEEAGAEIVGVCRSVGEAVAAAQANGIEAAVLDFRLGQETIGPVARMLAQCGTPFVFYTGQTEEASRLLAEWPRSRFVAKPAPVSRVVAAIADVLHLASPEAHGARH